MKPTIIMAQGRSGGTAISDALARVTGAPYLLEPLHPDLLAIVGRQPAATRPFMRHRTLRDHPWSDFLHYTDDLRGLRATHLDSEQRVLDWLGWLIAKAKAPPVMKLARGWQYLDAIRTWFPDVCIIHVWREFDAQQASRQRVGFRGDYFGDHACWGLKSDEHRAAWAICRGAASSVANGIVQYEQICLGSATKRNGRIAQADRILRHMGLDQSFDKAIAMINLMDPAGGPRHRGEHMARKADSSSSDVVLK